MAIFESALRFVLSHEGGLNENKSDRGDITNKGISLRFLKSLSLERLDLYEIKNLNENSVRNISDEQINMIYYHEFWLQAPFAKIQNQILCNYIFDMAVNHGIEQATKLTQRAVWACQKKKDYIKDDGVLGSMTLQAINQCSFMLLVALQAQRDGFYRRLVSLDPSQKEFLDGWLERCYKT